MPELRFDNPLFLISAIAGLIFVIAGFLLIKFPPIKINALYGYRTSSSMSSQERWEFSQKFAARQMLLWGFVLVFISIVGLLFDLQREIGLVLGLGALFIVAFFTIFRTERAIKDRFNNLDEM